MPRPSAVTLTSPAPAVVSMVRDASYAKRARTIVVNNIIGSGVGMQAQIRTSRDELNKRVNDDIEATWADWSEARVPQQPYVYQTKTS